MPAPPEQPTDFRSILEQVWWRLDAALDLEMLRWSAMLGAVEALQCGTTAIIDHHESPNAIEGSLDVIADACAEVGVRVSCAYGVTDRHGHDAALRGLAENERFLRAGGHGMVGVHAAFTCQPDTLEAAADLAQRLGVGVHIHVAEGLDDVEAGVRLEPLAADDWLIVHCVHLDRPLRGTIAHNPRSNMNNAVGYAAPTSRGNPVVLGTDGIGADMLEEARLAYVALRAHDVTASPDTVWSWLGRGLPVLPRCPRRSRHVELRPRRLAVARRVHAGRARARRRVGRRRGAAARRPTHPCRRRRGARPRRRTGDATVHTAVIDGRFGEFAGGVRSGR